MRVQIVNEVKDREPNEEEGHWALCFQWCRYIDGSDAFMGYRFIWRRPNGSLQAARGQARIVSIKKAEDLMNKAKSQGWGGYEEE